MKQIYTTNVKVDMDGNFDTNVETKTVEGVKYAKITFHGIENWYPVELLIVVAMTNCPLELKHLRNMRWVKQPQATRYKLPGFFFIWFVNEHPTLDNGARIVPCYWLSAVNGDGTEYYRKIDGVWVEAKIKVSEYLKVSVKLPCGLTVTTMLHRLVALAWVKNDKPTERNLVDHDDGDKHNPMWTNLKWCTYAENNLNAFKQGLKTQNKTIHVKHMSTGKVNVFDVMREAANHIGCTPSGLTQHISDYPDCIFFKEWLVSYTGEFPTNPRVAGQHSTYSLEDPTGKKFSARSLRAITEFSPVEFSVGLSFNTCLKKLDKLGWILSRGELTARMKLYSVLHVKSESEKTFGSKKEVSRKTGINEITIGKMLRLGPYMENKGFAIKIKDDKPWPGSYKPFTNVARRIKAVKNDGYEETFKSIREAELETGVNQKAISRSLKGEVIKFDFEFSYE